MANAAIRASVLLGVLLALAPVRAQTDLVGPLRIRGMTPFDVLRLEMLPAHAIATEPGSFAVEADLSYTNTFVMSGNVRDYLASRGGRRPLTRDDVDALLATGEDLYYVDGELALLDLTLHYGATPKTSFYLTIPAYHFDGGFLDGGIEGFHRTFGIDNEPRQRAGRNRSQAVIALGELRTSYLAPPVRSGLGDPVIGARHAWPLGPSWALVLDGALKVAWSGERPFLSTGTHDLGLQTSLQGKLGRQGVYLSASAVWTDGRVLGVPLGRRLVPTVNAAYEVGVTRLTNLILQLYASESAFKDATVEEIRANKYEASVGLRRRSGRFLYGFAVTENVANFENTPDVGFSLTLAWTSAR